MAWQVEHNGMATAAVARSLNKRGITGKRGGKWQGNSITELSAMTSTPTDSNSLHRIGGGQNLGIGPNPFVYVGLTRDHTDGDRARHPFL